MWIANLFYTRTVGLDEKHQGIGKVWSDGCNHFIRLNGWRFGQCAGLPFSGVSGPYISGDLIAYGIQKPESTEREEQWCGWIWTQARDGDGAVIYQVMLEVDPWPLIFTRKRAESDASGEYRYGVILGVKE